jgi:hypothetical protein
MKVLLWEVTSRSDFGRDYFDCDTLEQAIKSLEDDGGIDYYICSLHEFEQDLNDEAVNLDELWCKIFE